MEQHKIWYDTDNEVLQLEFTRDYLESDVAFVRQQMLEQLEGKPYRQIVIMISKDYKVENRNTRELANQAFINADISDVAFVGGSAANRMIVKVMIKTGALKNKGKFFKSKEEAINWIKGNR